MENKREEKAPSIILTLLKSFGIIIIGSVLAVSITPIFFLIGLIGSTIPIIRAIKKLIKLGKEEQVKQKEKKQSLFSKIKNKFKSKKKNKNKENKHIKKESNVKKDNNSKNIDRDVISSKKIDDIKIKKQQLQELKNTIIDGQYGLKKDEIIQDRVNGREIIKYYKKTLMK